MTEECHYIKTNGVVCRSPALSGKRLCFFHNRHREELVRLNLARTRRLRNVTIAMPVLEDANAVQMQIAQVLRLLLMGAMDHKTAGLALYGLQIASGNLARTSFGAIGNVVLVPGADHVENLTLTYEAEPQELQETADVAGCIQTRGVGVLQGDPSAGGENAGLRDDARSPPLSS